MGKPSRLSKQAVSRKNHLITSALGSLHFSAENLSSGGGRAEQQSDVTPAMQDFSTWRGRRVVGERTVAAHCAMKASEHVSPHWASYDAQASPG